MAKLRIHAAAFLTVAVWGVTFISTKVLLGCGFAPTYIFEIRFLIAYIAMWGLCIGKFGLFRARPGKTATRIWCDSVKDELGMLFCGITGGSLYFVTENTALEFTQASNVSFIVCTAPLFTVLLTILCKRVFPGLGFVRELENVKLGPGLIAGTVLALSGMALVIFDGSSDVSFSAGGDFLALSAALLWAVYSLEIGSLTVKYGSIMTTRKVFFYGLVTALPFLNAGMCPTADMFTWPAIMHLLFLSVVASFGCFAVWNAVMHSLGNVTASNYVYFNPVFTLVAAVIFLGESLTVTAALGSAAILTGVILAGMPKNPLFQRSFIRKREES